MKNLYALSLDQAVNLVATVGTQRTVLLQGHMGCGKSSTLDTLAEMFPDHHACYFDCTTKDLGDISIPSLNTDEGYVKYLPNEEFGLHTGKPVILMVDEFGKANPAVKNALLRDMLERDRFPEGSIIYATTNLGAEGVGDLLPPHARNRIITVEIAKPTPEALLEFGINDNWDHSVLGFIKDFPQVLQSFQDVPNPADNPYIMHPKEQRTAFITPRSLHSTSDTLKMRDQLDDVTLTAALIGTIGERGALDMMAFVKLADQLPSLQSIKQDPDNAPVPTSASAVCMVVYRAVSMIERDWVDAWITYLRRLDKEAQGLFVNCIRANNYGKRDLIMQSNSYGQWAVDNNYMFAADKK
jgi:energy-coupling factor transporter ATP-binding protein EcfA2